MRDDARRRAGPCDPSVMSDPTPSRAPAPRGRWAELRSNLATVPNQLTALRLASVPLLWVLAVLGMPVWVGIGLIAASLTDLLDGWLSRRWNQTSDFGSRLDSVADHLLATSTAIWLAMLRPFFFREQKWPLIAWAVFALFVLAVSWVKFRRMVDLHLYSAKVAVVMAFLFGIPLLVLGRYSRLQFWVTFAVCGFAAVEALAVILTRDRVDEHLGTVFRRRRVP